MSADTKGAPEDAIREHDSLTSAQRIALIGLAPKMYHYLAMLSARRIVDASAH